MLEVSLSMFFLHICVGVESDKHKFVGKRACEFVVSSFFAHLVAIFMRMFVCLDRQYCIAYLQAVVDLSPALVALHNAWHYFVVDESFESGIDRTTHQYFKTYGWELLDVAIKTVFCMTKIRNFLLAHHTRCARIV